MRNNIIYMMLALCLPIQGSRIASAAEDVPVEQDTDLIITEFVTKLKGIERYYIIETIDNKTLSLQKIKSLMDFRLENVPEKLSALLENAQAKDYNYAISNINRKAGYMSLYSIGSEIRISKTYWNIDRDRKLLATLTSLCTTVCESNTLEFKLITKNRVSDTNYHVEIPDLIYKPEYFLKDWSNTTVFANDAVGVSVKLPEKGVDILFSLDGDVRADDRNVFNGNCVKLAWDREKENFKLKSPEFCN